MMNEKICDFCGKKIHNRERYFRGFINGEGQYDTGKYHVRCVSKVKYNKIRGI